MKPFSHGGDVFAYEGEVLDFSANLNPLGMPECVREAVREAAGGPSRYPDPFCRALTAHIAAHEQLPGEWVLCGNGAADLIYRFAWAVKPRRALLVSPCFSEYEAALRTVGSTVAFHDLRLEEFFSLTPDILPKLTPDLDSVFLCSPNNPTGLTVAPGLLEQVLERAAQADILVVLDECFADLLDDPCAYTAKAYLRVYPNVLLLKAFTKTYAMAGLRLGYGLCADVSLLEKMRQAGAPWAVSTVAQAAGVVALSDPAYLPKTRQILRAERAFLTDGLQKNGCQVWDSQANYLFFRARCGLKEALLDEGILLRSCADYRGLDGSFYRAAVRLREDNVRLLCALQKLGGCR